MNMKRYCKRFAVQGASLWVAVFLVQGCAYWDPAADRDLRLYQEQAAQRRLNTLRQANARYQQELAAVRNDIRTLQDTQRKLMGIIDDLRRENHVRATQAQELQGLVAALEARMQTQDRQWQERMYKLKQALAEEQQRTMDAMAKSVAVEISSAVKKVQTNQQAVSENATREYTVVAGDTLSAIAKAFRVSVAAIKQANGMKSDVIRVGQTLNIPVR